MQIFGVCSPIDFIFKGDFVRLLKDLKKALEIRKAAKMKTPETGHKLEKLSSCVVCLRSLFGLVHPGVMLHVCHCGYFADRCSEKVDPGPCQEKYTRWYFDNFVKKCLKFIYGGCKGSNNRFRTLKECEAVCYNGRKSGWCLVAWCCLLSAQA